MADPYEGVSTDQGQPGVRGRNTVDGEGVAGESDAGRGVAGYSRIGQGVFGHSQGQAGVVGDSDQFDGVWGESRRAGMAGVSGHNGNPEGGNGVAGFSDAGRGVYGSSKTWQGVYGLSESQVGVAGESRDSDGVWGVSRGKGQSGVSGVNDHVEGGNGVAGHSDAGRGVAGTSKTWQGVYGFSESQVGVAGESQDFDGVWGDSHGAGHAGVSGHNSHAEGIGVYGKGGRLAAFFEGDVEVTGDIRLVNADCAEDFDVAGDERTEPGTVMVVGDTGALAPSRCAYDKRVAGVISGAGGYRPGIVLDGQPTNGNRSPLALLGKTYCKVDAQYAAIEVGDLLATSDTPGHAMKVSDSTRALGTVIGKALRPLANGVGLIPILIALQ